MKAALKHRRELYYIKCQFCGKKLRRSPWILMMGWDSTGKVIHEGSSKHCAGCRCNVCCEGCSCPEGLKYWPDGTTRRR